MFNKKTMSTFWLAIIGGIILATFIGLKIFTDHLPEAYVHINDKDLYVMVADTPSRWFKGLSGRKNLGIYDGMLFVFPDVSRRTMVMRDMNFALDVVWIKNSKIIDIKQNLLPEPGKQEAELTHYSPADSADMVIELVGGYAAQNGIKVGDEVKVDIRN